MSGANRQVDRQVSRQANHFIAWCFTKARLSASLCICLCLSVQCAWAAQWSIYHGPYVAEKDAREQQKYVRNVSSLPVEVWKIRGDYFLLIGVFDDAEVARDELQGIQDSGFEEAFLQQRSLQNGVRLHRETSEPATQVVQERSGVETSLIIDSRDPVLPKRVKEQGDDMMPEPLQAAWSELAYGRLQAACEQFAVLSQNNEYKISAFDGWGRCLQQQGQHQAAIEKFKWLVAQNYQPLKTLPRLIASLEVTGQLIEQYKYEGKLQRAKEQAGIEHNEDVRIHQQALAFIQRNQTQALNDFIAQHEARFRQCRSVDVLLESAQFFRHHTLPSKAVNTAIAVRFYRMILDACRSRWQLRVGVFESLATLLAVEHFSPLVADELQRRDYPVGYRQRIVHAATVNIMQRVYALPRNSEEKLHLIEQVLAIAPNHWPALTALGWTHYHRQDYQQALTVFRGLHQTRRKNREAAQGVYYSLVALNQGEQAKTFALANGLQKQLKESLERELASAEEQDKALIAKQILVLDAKHGWALTVLGWHEYRRGQFQTSWDHFVSITQLPKHRRDPDAWEGRLLAIIATQNWAGAQREIARSPFNEAQQRQWQVKLHRAKIQQAYDAGEFATAIALIDELPALGVEVSSEDQQLKAWCQHNMGDSEAALFTFVADYEKRPNPKSAEGVLLMLAQTGRMANYNTLLERLAHSSEPEYRAVAGQTLQHQTPQLAAQYMPASEASIENWHGASAELHYLYSEQNGSAGASKFIRRIRSVWLHSPWYGRWQGAVVLHDEHLTPGQITNSNFGRDYYDSTLLDASLGGPQNDDWTQSHWRVYTPQLRLNYTGQDHEWNVILGTTAQQAPVAPVAPVPAGRLSVSKGGFLAEAFRLPRQDSMLAYVGMVDPYATANVSQSWGRVLESGASIANDWPLGGAHWLSGSLKAAELSGFEVKTNAQRYADLAYGQTDQRWGMIVTRGLLLAYQQHSFDGDYYTHGHGGVYTPNGANLGLLLNLESIPRTPSWWRLDLSATYYQVSTDDVAAYPLTQRPEQNEGGAGDGIAYRMAGRWHHLFARKIKAYAGAEWTVAGGYQYWQALLGVQWYFDGRATIALPDAPTNIWGRRAIERR